MSQPATVRHLASQAFARATGAELRPGNAVRLLRDGSENYPAWLAAIAAARHHVHFECYLVHDDVVGRSFAAALAERAAAGVHVRVVYDWLGGLGAASSWFWRRLRRQGVEVRCFNTPRLHHPFDWLRRDHRKCLLVDGEVAYVSGLCVGDAWVGDREHGTDPWRDTGVEIRGPAVGDVARAFAETWAALGSPLPSDEGDSADRAAAGETSLRVVAATSGTTSLFRLDILVTALAKERLWLTDAYYVGTGAYVQSLRSAASDGVDVRLLVPGRGSDVAVVQAISRAGYRPLLEAGVRVFEWNGPMIHAKTAVADGKWARVGSTNLNLASWIGNWELDVVVEDETFARAMEAQYELDLAGATEIVLDPRFKVSGVVPERPRRVRGAGGSAGRAAAGALRLGRALGAAVASRVHGPAESRLMAKAALALIALAPIGILWPRVYAWPLSALSLWLAVALLLEAWRARRADRG